MSVVTQKDFEPQGLHSHAAIDMMEITDDCFICGKKLTVPFVYWHRGPGSLSLHPECAGRLAGGLMRDYLEVKIDRPWASAWWNDFHDTYFSR